MTLKTGRWNCLTHTSRCAPYLTAHTVLLYTNASPADRDIPDTQPFPPLDIHRFLPCSPLPRHTPHYSVLTLTQTYGFFIYVRLYLDTHTSSPIRECILVQHLMSLNSLLTLTQTYTFPPSSVMEQLRSYLRHCFGSIGHCSLRLIIKNIYTSIDCEIAPKEDPLIPCSEAVSIVAHQSKYIAGTMQSLYV